MNNNSIQVFNNPDFSVRTFTDEEGIIWFVAKDVAEALEYSASSINNNISNLFANVPDIWKGNKRINTPGGMQSMACLTEQGLYFFLGRSDKPKALPYQMWIAGEVVPSLRATGSYSMQEKKHAPAVQAEHKKPALPQTSAPVKAADKIYTKAFKAKTDKDFQAVLALDQAFIDTFGRSALEIAGLRIEYRLVEVPTTFDERMRMPKEAVDVWTKWVNAYVLVRDDQIISSSADERKQY